MHGMQWRQWIWTYVGSDVYDAILCVRSGHLFTWTRMMVVNAIVWKKLIDICFLIKSSLLALTAAPTRNSEEWWVDEAVPPVTFPDVYCYLIVTPCDDEVTVHIGECVTGWLHRGKAESIGLQLCDFRMGHVTHVTTGAEAQFCLSFQRCVGPTPSFVLKSGQASASIRSRIQSVGCCTDWRNDSSKEKAVQGQRTFPAKTFPERCYGSDVWYPKCDVLVLHVLPPIP